MTTETGPRVRGGRMPKDARRAQLLQSALEVFGSQGYHAAAMDDIAERAGVSKPVLYQHFHSGKFELYLALLDDACTQVVQAVRDALASTTDNKARVAATTEAFYRYIHDADGTFQLVFESDLMNEPDVRARIDRVNQECSEAIVEVISDDTGLPKAQAQLLAMALVGMSQVSARFWLTEDSAISREDAVALISSLAWRGIRGFPRQD